MFSSVLAGVGRQGAFCFSILRQLGFDCARSRLRLHEAVDHIFLMGVTGIPTTLFCMAFLSSVMVLELAFHMRLVVHQDAMIPSFTTVLLLRELGPVVTAMLLTSRVGAAISAELATLRTTGQLDALVLAGVDPINFLVLPRVFGCFVSLVALSLCAVAGALVISAFTTASFLGLTVPLFLSHLFLFSEATDLSCCLFKAAIFGILIPVIACYQGLQAPRGSEGVGEAATRSVVQASVGIVVLDFLVSWLWYAV